MSSTTFATPSASPAPASAARKPTAEAAASSRPYRQRARCGELLLHVLVEHGFAQLGVAVDAAHSCRFSFLAILHNTNNSHSTQAGSESVTTHSHRNSVLILQISSRTLLTVDLFGHQSFDCLAHQQEEIASGSRTDTSVNISTSIAVTIENRLDLIANEDSNEERDISNRVSTEQVSKPVAREPEFAGAEAGVEQQHAAGAARGGRAALDAVHGERVPTRRVHTLDARGASRRGSRRTAGYWSSTDTAGTTCNLHDSTQESTVHCFVFVSYTYTHIDRSIAKA